MKKSIYVLSGVGLIKKIVIFLKLIKFEHTIFATPFLILAIVVVKFNGTPNIELDFFKLFNIIICFVCARALGMVFNRIIDYYIDFKNPRTLNRPLQQRAISMKEAYIFALIVMVIFIYATYRISFFAFILSPFLILYMIFYAYTKRFTYLCHFILGSIHAMLPLAICISFFDEVYPYLFFLSLGIMFLIASSDIIYAIQDIKFDIREKLYSIPAKCGVTNSIVISFILYVLSLVFFLIFFFYLKNFKPLYTIFAIMLSFIIILFMLTKTKKYTTLFTERAFFLNNVVVGILLTLGALFDCYRNI